MTETRTTQEPSVRCYEPEQYCDHENCSGFKVVQELLKVSYANVSLPSIITGNMQKPLLDDDDLQEFLHRKDQIKSRLHKPDDYDEAFLLITVKLGIELADNPQPKYVPVLREALQELITLNSSKHIPNNMFIVTKWIVLYGLAVSYNSCFHAMNKREDLDRAIEHLRECSTISGTDGPVELPWKLGLLLFTRLQGFGSLDDIQDMTASFHKTLLLPARHPQILQSVLIHKFIVSFVLNSTQSHQVLIVTWTTMLTK